MSNNFFYQYQQQQKQQPATIVKKYFKLEPSPSSVHCNAMKVSYMLKPNNKCESTTTATATTLKSAQLNGGLMRSSTTAIISRPRIVQQQQPAPVRLVDCRTAQQSVSVVKSSQPTPGGVKYYLLKPVKTYYQYVAKQTPKLVNVTERIILSGAQHLASLFKDFSPKKPAPLDFVSLPPTNNDCYQQQQLESQKQPVARYFIIREPPVIKTITQNFYSTNNVVKENVTHYKHVKDVIINVNRNHWHTQRIQVNDKTYHHYLINNIVRVNDIHHHKVEKVSGEKSTHSDYKQTHQIEAASCENVAESNKESEQQRETSNNAVAAEGQDLTENDETTSQLDLLNSLALNESISLAN